MMIRSLICVLAILFLTIMGCSRTFDYPEAKITIKVVDEGGKPIVAANAGITFELPKGNGQGSYISEKGTTGADGIFSATGRTISDIAYGAEKQGYYKSYGVYHFTTSANGRWQPWNPEFKLVLRKIDNPVPMYARELSRELPVTGKKVGFDLMEYDWVAPHGKGIHSDIVFKLQKQVKSRDEFEGKLTIGFSNRFDGIQILKDDRKYGSAFKLPRLAPENGYQKEITLSRKRELGKSLESSYNEENNYIFRIRSEEKNGKLTRAMYGKIHGDISLDVLKSNTALVVFRYYLNPDYTKNLEFDPKQNLFKNLGSTEAVGLD